jgi:hypothetical protein
MLPRMLSQLPCRNIAVIWLIPLDRGGVAGRPRRDRLGAAGPAWAAPAGQPGLPRLGACRRPQLGSNPLRENRPKAWPGGGVASNSSHAPGISQRVSARFRRVSGG